ncbi:MAG: sodium-dependent transporter [Ruminococcaceae bacterium]|nr:sodium-dependent transporter [Oscillospiraceae bacterium]
MEKNTRGNFTGNIGFVLATAGSAIGLGNLWRFPYLAAKDGGGLFLLIYLALVLTFGFTLMTAEIAIGRKTGVGPLQAYGRMNKSFGFLGWISTAVPLIIFPYYCVIGGWIVEYAFTYTVGAAGNIYETGAKDFFTGFITSNISPLLCFVIFMTISAAIVILGVEKGIEKASKIMMPALFILIIGISIYSLTLSHTDENGVTRTAWDGLMIYLIPNFEGISFSKFISILLDAVGQLFYSLSVAMGIMITYGSYTKKDSNLLSSINQIELFDTGVAFLAGMIIIPTVFVFQGAEGLAASGPSLMFVSLPQVFEQMGIFGHVLGALFFILVFFAALTSAISLMEAVTTSIIDRFHLKRITATLVCYAISLLIGAVVCLGYNVFYLDIPLPNGSVGQILDLLDYVTNNLMLPIVALLTCIMIGWVCKPKSVLDEISIGTDGKKFRREKLFVVMIKFVAPVLLVVILLQAFNLFSFLG